MMLFYKFGVNGISNNLVFILTAYQGPYKISYLNCATFAQSQISDC